MEQKSHGLHTTIVECSPWFLFIKETAVVLEKRLCKNSNNVKTLLSYNNLLSFHNI